MVKIYIAEYNRLIHWMHFFLIKINVFFMYMFPQTYYMTTVLTI